MPLLPPTRPAKARTVASTSGAAECRCACFATSSNSHCAAILLHMQTNPAEDWHSLTEHYRAMLDGELEELADSLDDLTETAKEVLRSEMRNRGLGEPGAKPLTRGSEAPAGARWVSSVRPDGQIEDAGKGDAAYGPNQFTWKTPLCECDSEEQALAICQALTRAGIENWYERPGSRMGIWGSRIVVAADRLDEAREVAAQPIAQDVIDEFRQEVPEYIPPKCPKCGTEDPVLESAEPTNSWLCEACGKQWAEPAIDVEDESARDNR
jgi:hypothetical protein